MILYTVLSEFEIKILLSFVLNIIGFVLKTDYTTVPSGYLKKLNMPISMAGLRRPNPKLPASTNLYLSPAPRIDMSNTRPLRQSLQPPQAPDYMKDTPGPSNYVKYAPAPCGIIYNALGPRTDLIDTVAPRGVQRQRSTDRPEVRPCTLQHRQ